MKKNVWIIAPFAGLGSEKYKNRFQYLGKMLCDENYDIDIFTSDFKHLAWDYYDEGVVNGFPFKVHLIHESGYTSTISPKRAISHIVFARNLMKKVKTMKKPDLIYCAYPTMTAAYLIGKYANENGIPFVLDVQDTWPESISSGIDTEKALVKLLMKPFTYFADSIYRKADLVFGVSETYANRGRVKGSKAKDFISVYIGAEGNKFETVEYKNLKNNIDDIWITYIGTLSHSYDIETAILAFDKLKEHPNIQLHILGDGPDFQPLHKKAEELGLLNKTVFFKGMLPYEEMINYLNNSDIALNAIKGKALQTITNKFGDYVSAGLPMLNSCQAKEVLSLVEKRGLGRNYTPSDVESLKCNILNILKDSETLDIYSKNCKKFAKEKFDRKESYKVIYDKLKELIGE